MMVNREYCECKGFNRETVRLKLVINRSHPYIYITAHIHAYTRTYTSKRPPANHIAIKSFYAYNNCNLNFNYLCLEIYACTQTQIQTTRYTNQHLTAFCCAKCYRFNYSSFLNEEENTLKLFILRTTAGLCLQWQFHYKITKLIVFPPAVDLIYNDLRVWFAAVIYDVI